MGQRKERERAVDDSPQGLLGTSAYNLRRKRENFLFQLAVSH
jgi:hypothetical protein